jgi:membrane complex biogenesis BtpA family protein
MTPSEFRELFRSEAPLIGMIHLQPLPGAPRYAGDFPVVVDQARAEAEALVEAGFDGLLVENFNDVPFYPERAPAETVAAMAVAVREVRAVVPVPVGVNVLRNDGAAALAIAVATGAAFIRVNVLTGAMVTDQGLIQGRAHELLRLRRTLEGARPGSGGCQLFADVHVKHAQPLGTSSLPQAAEELVGRGLADAVVVSGAGTGKPTDPSDAVVVRAAVPGVAVIIGSGVTAATIHQCFEVADGVIIGSDLKRGGQAAAPLDRDRAAAFVRAARLLGRSEP